MGAPIKRLGEVKTPFTKIPNAIFDAELSDYAKIVYFKLLSYPDGFEITAEKVAKDTGKNRKQSAAAALKELDEAGLIRRSWKGHNQPKQYAVLCNPNPESGYGIRNQVGTENATEWVRNSQPSGYGIRNQVGTENATVIKTKSRLNQYIDKRDLEREEKDGRNSNPIHSSEDPGFEIFYSEFPSQRRGSKRKALERFEEAVANGYAPEEIVEGSRAYRDGLNDSKYHFGMQRFFDDEVFASASTARNEEKERAARAMAAYERLMADGY